MKNIQRRRRIQERTINSHREYDNSITREYSVSEMSKYLKRQYEIDFHNIETKLLKTKALNYEDYTLDIAHDIKELLSDSDQNKYFYIDVLLSEFKRNIKEAA